MHPRVRPVVVAPAAPTPVVPAIAFIGYQNSGKTTLVEKVIAELTRRGLRVGSLKHHGHHGFDIDVPAKDTWRHHQAGSKHVGLICATRWAEYADTREEDEMPARELLSRYNDVDVAIIEGYKTEGFDNIVVARSGVDRLRGKSSLDLVDGRTLALACNEALARQAFDAGFATRAININDARAICDLIQDHLQADAAPAQAPHLAPQAAPRTRPGALGTGSLRCHNMPKRDRLISAGFIWANVISTTTGPGSFVVVFALLDVWDMSYNLPRSSY